MFEDAELPVAPEARLEAIAEDDGAGHAGGGEGDLVPAQPLGAGGHGGARPGLIGATPKWRPRPRHRDGGGAVRKRRGLRRGEPIGGGRAGSRPRLPAAPRRFQSLNRQRLNWPMAARGGGAAEPITASPRRGEEEEGTASQSERGRPEQRHRLPAGAAVHAGSCSPERSRGACWGARRRKRFRVALCFRLTRKWRSAACSGARRWRRGLQPGPAMADVTARSLQYEYKAVSAAPRLPAPHRPRTGPSPVPLTQGLPLNLPPRCGGPGSPREIVLLGVTAL